MLFLGFSGSLQKCTSFFSIQLWTVYLVLSTSKKHLTSLSSPSWKRHRKEIWFCSNTLVIWPLCFWPCERFLECSSFISNFITLTIKAKFRPYDGLSWNLVYSCRTCTTCTSLNHMRVWSESFIATNTHRLKLINNKIIISLFWINNRSQVIINLIILTCSCLDVHLLESIRVGPPCI